MLFVFAVILLALCLLCLIGGVATGLRRNARLGPVPQPCPPTRVVLPDIAVDTLPHPPADLYRPGHAAARHAQSEPDRVNVTA
jgi:hypothetical protein